MRDSLESLRTRGLLFVDAGAGSRYTVVTALTPAAVVAGGKKPRVVASDTSVGLHWIVPGRYFVAAPGMRTQTVTIGTGHAIAVKLEQVIQ